MYVGVTKLFGTLSTYINMRRKLYTCTYVKANKHLYTYLCVVLIIIYYYKIEREATELDSFVLLDLKTWIF